MKQICKRCKLEKDTTEFYFRKDQNKYRTICKECHDKNNKPNIEAYRLKHEERLKIKNQKYYQDNNEHMDINRKKYYTEHSEYYEKYRDEWYQQNKAHHSKLTKKYYENHKSEIYLKQKQRRVNDINFKLICNLRRRLHHVLKGKNKCKKTLDLLGCTMEQLKLHLEQQFNNGMNWDNYGFGIDKWKLDHIIPCASFDLSDPEQQKKCFHYTNLQPLWQLENILKSDRIDGQNTK
jgi:hypothetical protein